MQRGYEAGERSRRQPQAQPLRRGPVAHTASAMGTTANKPLIAIFSGTVVLTVTTLMATAASTPALTVGFRLGCSLMQQEALWSSTLLPLRRRHRLACSCWLDRQGALWAIRHRTGKYRACLRAELPTSLLWLRPSSGCCLVGRE